MTGSSTETTLQTVDQLYKGITTSGITTYTPYNIRDYRIDASGNISSTELNFKNKVNFGANSQSYINNMGNLYIGAINANTKGSFTYNENDNLIIGEESYSAEVDGYDSNKMTYITGIRGKQVNISSTHGIRLRPSGADNSTPHIFLTSDTTNKKVVANINNGGLEIITSDGIALGNTADTNPNNIKITSGGNIILTTPNKVIIRDNGATTGYTMSYDEDEIIPLYGCELLYRTRVSNNNKVIMLYRPLQKIFNTNIYTVELLYKGQSISGTDESNALIINYFYKNNNTIAADFTTMQAKDFKSYKYLQTDENRDTPNRFYISGENLQYARLNVPYNSLSQDSNIHIQSFD